MLTLQYNTCNCTYACFPCGTTRMSLVMRDGKHTTTTFFFLFLTLDTVLEILLHDEVSELE